MFNHYNWNVPVSIFLKSVIPTIPTSYYADVEVQIPILQPCTASPFLLHLVHMLQSARVKDFRILHVLDVYYKTVSKRSGEGTWSVDIPRASHSSGPLSSNLPQMRQ